MEAKPRRAAAPSPAASSPLVPNLVGSIIEKGFSGSAPATRPPAPTVLPFPVARHRSHGPHWNPLPVEVEQDDEMEVDVDEGKYESAAAFAKPLERKKRKELDFSRWKEALNGDASASALPRKNAAKPSSKVVKYESMGAGSGRNEDKEPVTAGAMELDAKTHYELHKEELMSLYTSECSETAMEDMQLNEDVNIVERKKTLNSDTGSNSSSMSLMDEIESENLTRIANMSADEIAEAQADIGKMSPSVIEMLKRRGKKKLGNKKSVAEGKGDGAEQKLENGASSTGRSIQEAVQENFALSGMHGGHLWRVWSEKVEKVRLFRFSLEGEILEMERLDGQTNDVKNSGVDSAKYVAERDFLRTEGDPAALGYTISEAVALARSMVPGQRALALKLISSILTNALNYMHKLDTLPILKGEEPFMKFGNWQAIWAYALGPEPQLALCLRLALDDNHDSVVLAGAKAILSLLSYDMNEAFFDTLESLACYEKDICTAPVFRSKPEQDGGFLHGGYWKYNTKPSNILPMTPDSLNDEEDAERTVHDDVTVAGQDVAAGFMRMSLLTRICYLLEMHPQPILEDCLVSILVALARHSPQSAEVIFGCPRLIPAVLKIVKRKDVPENYTSQIKGITLMKVLVRYNRKNCLVFSNSKIFEEVMWRWYRKPPTLESWIKSGREQCKFESALLVEQLRFWKACISHGLCNAYFGNFISYLCFWLSPPSIEKLKENDLCLEFCSITREAYSVFYALSQTLPVLHSSHQLGDNDTASLSWNEVIPIVESAIQWLAVDVQQWSSLYVVNKDAKHVAETTLTALLQVLSAVLQLINGVLLKIPSENMDGDNKSCYLPWIPTFVPKIGLQLIRSGYFDFSDSGIIICKDSHSYIGSIVKNLSILRTNCSTSLALSSVSCLYGLIQVACTVDKIVQIARQTLSKEPPNDNVTLIDGKILEEGIIKSANTDIMELYVLSMKLIDSEWPMVQSSEIFGRGGPAPGVGFGWGSSGRGFWSLEYLLVQLDSKLFLNLAKFIPLVLDDPFIVNNGLKLESTLPPGDLRRTFSLLEVCVVGGAGYRSALEEAFDCLFQVPVLAFLGSCIQHFTKQTEGLETPDFSSYGKEYGNFCTVLKSHFQTRWLASKPKAPKKLNNSKHGTDEMEKSDGLETIDEDTELPESKDSSHNPFVQEWAHQRLLLPCHWFLSSICMIGDPKSLSTTTGSDVLDVARAGLFFVLGLEAASSLVGTSSFPTSAVPLVWKIHSLSMSLHANMDLLQEDLSRNMFECLQKLYGQHIDRLRQAAPLRSQQALITSIGDSEAKDVQTDEQNTSEILGFEKLIHNSYTTFVESLIEQFASESYGDTIFGRQVAVYLHSGVEATVRLAAWNALGSALALDYLPPLDKCIGSAEGYLFPIEDNEAILEAYTRSWTTGALDKAAIRRSVSSTLALHHLSGFLFVRNASEKPALRKKLAKSLLQCYARRSQTEGMLLSLVLHEIRVEQRGEEVARRFIMLKDACRGNPSLEAAVDKLRSLAGS